MIRPHKYMNLEFSVISTGASILQLLQEKGTIKYDELLDSLIDRKGNSVKENFLVTLSFLFLIGKIEYHKSLDCIELRK